MTEPTIHQQIAYYDARADEYDQWFFRDGRYYRGATHKQCWMREIEVVRAALTASIRGPDILELACGTGLWTRQLVGEGRSVTALDASTQMLALNRKRLSGHAVRYLQSNLFEWTPDHTYDLIFFGFWLLHVPVDRFESFWEMLSSALNKNGKVFFVDSLLNPESSAVNHPEPTQGGSVTRLLDDGREFDIFKTSYEPHSLTQRLRTLGWTGETKQLDRFFLYGRFEHS